MLAFCIIITSGLAVADNTSGSDYTAEKIEILEGLEPVRRHPGMYIGGTDERALYHMLTEVLDNAMDEVISGYASKVFVALNQDGSITVKDNGRGIPIDEHPKYPGKSALEVIMTTLHSGGKFNNKSYSISGGLHGVGVSVVNALSEFLEVSVRKNRREYKQTYSRGETTSKLSSAPTSKLHGTLITFKPDKEIFDSVKYDPDEIYRMLCSKAYLYRKVSIVWKYYDENLSPVEKTIHFPNGLVDYLTSKTKENELLFDGTFSGESKLEHGELEWAIRWDSSEAGYIRSYCNAIYTPSGGTHVSGIKNALFKSIKRYVEASKLNIPKFTVDDIIKNAMILVSIFIPDPAFQGQTKEKLLTNYVSKTVEAIIGDHMDHWLVSEKEAADALLAQIEENCTERQRSKQKKAERKSIIKRSILLPTKLADCINKGMEGTELFIVEGDSAGGTAKQARDRSFQAILPLLGKVLNSASNTQDKIANSSKMSDLIVSLGCGIQSTYDYSNLRYEKVIIMTDADIDGAHIACLLLTFFMLQMEDLVSNGHIYLAKPPLYRIKRKGEVHYVFNEEEKMKYMSGKVEVSRFKGLGEMSPAQLQETTMSPKTRSLIQMQCEGDIREYISYVSSLMGRDAQVRLDFIKSMITQKDINQLIDV